MGGLGPVAGTEGVLFARPPLIFCFFFRVSEDANIFFVYIKDGLDPLKREKKVKKMGGGGR